MKITGMAYGHPHPLLGEHPFVLQQRSKLKNLTERRQVEVAALQDLQRESANGIAPGTPPSHAIAAQLDAKRRLIASLDVAAAVIAGSMPAGGKSKRNRP